MEKVLMSTDGIDYIFSAYDGEPIVPDTPFSRPCRQIYVGVGGKAKRSSEPIETLDDLIDIPDSLVPLFVNKVLANAYHLQGKEAPITIKRRIKELE